MNSHLTLEQIIDALLDSAERNRSEQERECGEPSEAREAHGEHLSGCEKCGAEVEATRSLFAAFGNATRQEAARDEIFWARQRLLIASRIEQDSRRRVWRMVWGAAAATAAALVFGIALGKAPSVPKATPDSVVAKQYEGQDDLLLRHVEAALERPAPMALAPAEVLTRELNRGAAPPRNKQGARPLRE
jgi:anti-sigma-K factor RskA